MQSNNEEQQNLCYKLWIKIENILQKGKDFCLTYQNQQLTEQNDQEASQLNSPFTINDFEKETQNKLALIQIINTKKIFHEELEIRSLGFNHDDTIIYCVIEKYIIFFTSYNGQMIVTNILVDTAYIQNLIFSKKSNWFVTCYIDNTLIFWKLQNRTWQKCEKQQHNARIHTFLLNKNENELITGCNGNIISVWKIDQNKNILTHLYNFKNINQQYVLFMDMNSNENYLLTKDRIGINLWDMKNKKKYKSICFKKFPDENYRNRISFIDINRFVILIIDQGILQFQKIKGKNIELQNQLNIKFFFIDQYFWNLGGFEMIYDIQKKMLYIQFLHKTIVVNELRNQQLQVKEYFQYQDQFGKQKMYHTDNFDKGTFSVKFNYSLIFDYSHNQFRLYSFDNFDL